MSLTARIKVLSTIITHKHNQQMLQRDGKVVERKAISLEISCIDGNNSYGQHVESEWIVVNNEEVNAQIMES